jgi:hypothetical protein
MACRIQVITKVVSGMQRSSIDTSKAQQFLNLAIPIAIVAVLLAFITAATILIWQNSHFIGDDISHIDNMLKMSSLHYLLAPIDVHFVPLHKLASFLIYKISPFDFRVALGFMVAGWIITILITYRVLIRLTSNRAAWIILFIFGANQFWIYNLMWWSSAMHRLPYLLFQAATLLYYLRYRENKHIREALFCIVMQICAVGFFEMAVIYPLVLAALEVCLAFMERRFSRVGIKLCLVMAAISMLYMTWYLVFAPVERTAPGINILNTVSVVFLFIIHLSSMLLLLPIDQSWSIWVSCTFWFGLAIFYIWRRPGSMLPIAILLVLLLMNFAIVSIGRNIPLLCLSFTPSAFNRFYLDQLVIIGIFSALVIGRHANGNPPVLLNWRRYGVYAMSLMFIILYPIASYQTSKLLLLDDDYSVHRKTRNFMVNIRQSLQELSTAQPHAAIASRRFPVFVDSIDPQQVENIFGPLYPQFKWVPFEKWEETNKVMHICDDGSLVPNDKHDPDPCADQTEKAGLFVHKLPDFSVTFPQDGIKPRNINAPTSVLSKMSNGTVFIVSVEDMSNLPADATMKDVPKLSCLSLHKIFNINATNCQTLYEREIKLKDGTPAYEYEVRWEALQSVFYTYRMTIVKDKKSIVADLHTFNPVSDELKEYPLSLTFQ